MFFGFLRETRHAGRILPETRHAGGGLSRTEKARRPKIRTSKFEGLAAKPAQLSRKQSSLCFEQLPLSPSMFGVSVVEAWLSYFSPTLRWGFGLVVEGKSGANPNHPGRGKARRWLASFWLL